MVRGVLVKEKMASNSKWKKSFFFIRDNQPWSWNLLSKREEDSKDTLSSLEIKTVAAFEEMVKEGISFRFEEVVSSGS